MSRIGLYVLLDMGHLEKEARQGDQRRDRKNKSSKQEVANNEDHGEEKNGSFRVSYG